MLGDFRAYIAPEVRLKTRECRYNEVQDAQDITKQILNLGHNFALEMNIPRKDIVHSQGKFQVWYGLYMVYKS